MTRMNGVAVKLSKVLSNYQKYSFYNISRFRSTDFLFPLSQCGFLINTNTLVLSLLQIETV